MRYRQPDSPRFIAARFDSTCAETGRPIRKGETILYRPDTRRAYCDESREAADARSQAFARSAGMADANW